MQLPAVCSARRNHGKNKMSAKCLLQILCIQSVKETFELQLSWQKFRLSTLVRMLVESCTHLCSEANRLPRIIRRPRPTQGGARQGIRHFPPTIWKLATATATATAAAAVLFCAMVFSRPGPTFLQQPAAGAAGRQQQSSQQSRSR